jgi:hypothetical protein
VKIKIKKMSENATEKKIMRGISKDFAEAFRKSMRYKLIP